MKDDYDKDINRYLDLFARVNGALLEKEISLGIVHEIAKDNRLRIIREMEAKSGNGFEAGITPRQKAFLEARGVPTAGMSKQAASEAIDRIKSEEAM